MPATTPTWKISIGLNGRNFHKYLIMTCDREDIDLIARDLTAPGIKCKVESVENILPETLKTLN